jgi:hypothetical protein
MLPRTPIRNSCHGTNLSASEHAQSVTVRMVSVPFCSVYVQWHGHEQGNVYCHGAVGGVALRKILQLLSATLPSSAGLSEIDCGLLGSSIGGLNLEGFITIRQLQQGKRNLACCMHQTLVKCLTSPYNSTQWHPVSSDWQQPFWSVYIQYFTTTMQPCHTQQQATLCPNGSYLDCLMPLCDQHLVK